jgi:mannosyltransferase OCH1-like enzyme
MVIDNNIKLFILLCIIFFYIKLTTIPEPESRILYTMPFHIERTSSEAPRAISGVPLTIYQSWHSNQIPTKMRETVYSLLEMNPEFDYYLYSDDACRKFIKDNFNEDVVDAFDTLKPGAYKSDLWRYCILYKMGGVYLDIKFRSLEPLVPIIEKNSEIFVRDIPINLSFDFDSYVYNAFMVSPPNNPIFKECIEDIVSSCKRKVYKFGKLDLTGPGCLMKFVKKHKGDKYINTLSFHNSTTSIYQYLRYKDVIVVYNNKAILRSYAEYRSEQKIFQKTAHYSHLWLSHNVYN